MQIDFTRIPMFINISKTACKEVDFSETVADTLYTQCQGVQYGALALKIYNAHGRADYTDEEVRLLREFLDRFKDALTPSAYDALTAAAQPQGTD